MSYKEVGGTRRYPKYAECEEGETIVEGLYKKSFEGKFGIQYEILEDSGGIVILNSSGALDNKMQYVDPETRIKVVYNGSKPITKGKFAGKEFHDIAVFAENQAEKPLAEVAAGDESEEGGEENFL